MLSPGTKLGPHEILSLIGAGGMGEVYRARDTRLDRIVAIKVLPAHLADNPELRERFEREARTIASLNHPHICTLYDIGRQDGTDFLVMEYLEGETLSMRLLKGPLPLEQLLRYAIEVSDALDKAHRKGVTHRDIKPGNIMLIPQSGTKLLDFGLAKLKQETAPAAVPLSQLPTAGPEAGKNSLTIHGTILGTLQYMAPEQVEGKTDELDSRTDIFSFGAVLYEMATGKKAFEGKSTASLFAKILEHDPPPISSLQPMTPPALDRVVKRCLAKEPDERWQTASDLTHELKWIAEGGSQSALPVPVAAQRKTRERLAWLAAAVLLISTLALSLWVVSLRRPPAEPQPVRFSVGPPEDTRFSGQAPFLSISPDGSNLAFVGVGVDSSAKRQLWIRALDSEAAQPLPGTENPDQPFWSADSRFLAFYADGKLKKIAVTGGPAQTLTEAPLGATGTWSREGVVLFGTSAAAGASGVFLPSVAAVAGGPTISRVSATGGVATPVTALDASRQESGHYWPHFLPDGNHFLYLARSRNPENSAIYAASLDSQERKLIVNADSNVVYVPPGYLLFNREGTLMAQAFDAQRLEVTGEEVSIAEDVQFDTDVKAAFTASENGVLAYRTGASASTQLVWFDRTGKEIGMLGDRAAYGDVALSPDDKRAVISIPDPERRTRDLWIYDIARGLKRRFTINPTHEQNPVWSPDGSRIIFASNLKGRWNLYQRASDGSGSEEVLLEDNVDKFSGGWSPDGRFFLYSRAGGPAGADRDLFVLPLSGDRKPVSFLQTQFIETFSRFSPDGRWVAYISNESGGSEVYVAPFPGPGGKSQVSTAGGDFPQWRRDGTEIFYRALDNRLMAAAVNGKGTSFEVGTVKPLFQTTAFLGGRWPYDVSADGQRFLINTLPEQVGSAPITVVLNWTAALPK